LQVVVVVLSHSVALLGDTLHNLADVLTAGPLLVAFHWGARPATRRFTYGYGRAKDRAGLVVLLFITAPSGVAAYVAIDRLLPTSDTKASARHSGLREPRTPAASMAQQSR
jgi:cation diffusion facilitator family transporter